MILRCGVLLAILSCVQPKDFHRDGSLTDLDNDFNSRFSLWPSVHNAAKLWRIRRASQAVNTLAVESPPGSGDTQGPSEGIGGEVKPPTDQPTSPAPTLIVQDTKVPKQIPQPANDANSPAEAPKNSSEMSNKTPKAPVAETTVAPTVNQTDVGIKDNGTNAEKATKQWDLSNPEATKRGLIVFGGFALLAMAYFIFYRTKSKYNEAGNPNGSSDSNQFRYGVLQSDDRRDNLELSRVPLTMESDEEEDEDLEIFDLGQKKKSLSYVNLQGTDEDIVLSQSQRQDNGNDALLLDIDDDNSDILINWTNNSKKT